MEILKCALEDVKDNKKHEVSLLMQNIVNDVVKCGIM